MTTIAYKNNVIAYDSRITNNGVIIDDNFDKLIRRENDDTLFKFFLSGPTCDYEKFAESYLNKVPFGWHSDVHALVLEFNKETFEDKLFTCGVSKEGSKYNIWRCPESLKNSIAIGSGRDFVLAYMDVGMSALQAITKVVERDVYTGGKIRYYDFSPNDKTL